MQPRDKDVECCGTCADFWDEDALGRGHCQNRNEQVKCFDYCDEWRPFLKF